MRPGRLCLLLAVALPLACAHRTAVRRFALQPPLWRDPDRASVPRQPSERFSGLYTGGFDRSVLNKLIEPLSVPLPGEAANVNSLDEVPDSSWFENRIGARSMTLEEMARGSCTQADIDGLRGPYQITSAKQDGVTRGVFVQAAGGVRYLFKLDDREHQPERGTAADVVGARIYHAVGYNSPCNQVVDFRASELRIAPGAKLRDELGRALPFTRQHLRDLLRRTLLLRDGRFRAMASRLIDGKPIGPYPASGVRADDPNDVIPHEDRRELRAARLLAAWLDRFDTREQNSLDVWVSEGGRSFVRHYQLDFGDAFGGAWRGQDRLNRRVGDAYFFDLDQIIVDFFTLGALPRPWRSKTRAGGATFGYFGWKGFSPARWKPISQHPAFSRMTWRDALWMVRRIVGISDAHLQAVVRGARLSDPWAEGYLLRALIERRNRIAETYLRRHVPLAEVQLLSSSPSLEPTPAQQQLCFADLGIRHAGVDAGRVVYRVRLLAGERLALELGRAELRPGARPDRTCVPLPVGVTRPHDLAPRGAVDDDPARYAVLELLVLRSPLPAGMMRVHLYDLGPRRGFYLAGLERLE